MSPSPLAFSDDVLNDIGGAAVAPAAGQFLDNPEPATGRRYARVAASQGVDVDRAVEAARAAQPGWAALASAERARLLRRVGALLRERLEHFARAESIDTGKPIALARSLDIPRAAQNFEFFADALTQWSSELHAESPFLNYTLRAPVGVVGCISPWNLPLYLLTWKVAPALAAGNAVVAKPSEITPLTAALLGEVIREAGLPKGAFNLVHGRGPEVGAALVGHPDVAAISFTGSTATGAAIASQATPLFKKVSLELGGKNPTIVFADCALESTLDGVVRSAFLNQGEICLCGSRILVERPIFERFRDGLVSRVAALRQGDPLDESTEQGAVVSRAHLDKVLGYLRLGREQGAQVLTGGEQVKGSGRCAEGWFIAPTLLAGVAPDSRLNQEEIFGPVATLLPFDREDEALALANGTRYGLAASLWTSDLSRAHRFAAGLRSGLVWVNCWMVRDLRTPFGGVKASGVGREGGLDAYRFFTEAKNVCVRV